MGNNVRIKSIPIMLDRERHLVFDFNSFAELEEIYKDLDILFEKIEKPTLKDLRNLLYAGLLHEDNTLTPLKVGALMNGLADLSEINACIFKAVTDAMPKTEGDSIKNVVPQPQEKA